MSLKERIDQDLKSAMKEKDQARLRALRALKSAILLEETAENRPEPMLTEEEELKLIAKQVKQRKDSATQYRENDREDLALTEEEELEVLETYMPEQLSADEIRAEVEKIIKEMNAEGMKDMGKVMGTATSRLSGKADGSDIARITKEILSA